MIDKDGNLRYTHAGEGKYDETENEIKKLLSEAGVKVDDKFAVDNVTKLGEVTATQSPESYLGWSRGERFLNSGQLAGNENKEVLYTLRTDLAKNQWSLGGGWQVDNDKIIAKKDSVLSFKFSAKEVYLVAGSDTSNHQIKVKLNGKAISSENSGEDVNNGVVTLEGQRMYKLVKLPKYNENQLLELSVEPGCVLYVFTFGS